MPSSCIVYCNYATNTELAKRIDALESLFDGRLESVVADLVSKCTNKLNELGFDQCATLTESVQHLSDVFDDMKAKQDELVASNRALSAKNEALEKKVADLEQYSRLNIVEIKGVPVT